MIVRVRQSCLSISVAPDDHHATRNAAPVAFSNGNPFLADLERSPLSEPGVPHGGNPVPSEILIDFGGPEPAPEASPGPETIPHPAARLLDDFDPLQRPPGDEAKVDKMAAEPEVVSPTTDLLGMMDPNGRPGFVEVYAAPPPGPPPDEDQAEPEAVVTSPEITSPPSEVTSQAEVTSPLELASPPEVVASGDVKKTGKDGGGGHSPKVGGAAAKASGSGSKIATKSSVGAGGGGVKGEHVEARADRKVKASPRPVSTTRTGAGGGPVAAAGAGGGDKPKDGASKTADASNAKSKTAVTVTVTVKTTKAVTPSAESPKKTRSAIKRGRKRHRWRNFKSN